MPMIPKSSALALVCLAVAGCTAWVDLKPQGQGVRILTDPATVLVLVSMPHKEEEFPGEKPEGEVAAEEPKEPEVIKKERAEKEEPEK